MELWYFVQATSSAAVEFAPIYIVKVGKSSRAQAAHADLCARSLASDDFYYCVRSLASSAFVRRLLLQNSRRDVYTITARQLCRLLDSTANVADVKNLSEVFQVNQSYLVRSVRGANFLTL